MVDGPIRQPIEHEPPRPVISCPEQAEDLMAIIERGKQIDEMVKTKGWLLLNEHIQDLWTDAQHNLSVAEDVREIRRYQATVRVTNSILNFIKNAHDRMVQAMSFQGTGEPK